MISTRMIIIMVGMVITGSINTISAKYSDMLSAKGIDGHTHKWTHPFVQAVFMFLGECMCLAAAKIMFFTASKKRRDDEAALLGAIESETAPQEESKFNPFIFLPAAMCDMTATSTMYVGLTMTYASSFQMLRGAVVIFTGIASIVFLGRKLFVHHWVGMVVVLGGLACVGLSSAGDATADASNPTLGNILIICAQAVVALQMVYEEKFIAKYKVPALYAVGWEGIFGFCVLSILLIPMYYLPHIGTDYMAGDRFENAPDAFVQMGNNLYILLAIGVNLMSIAFFNFCGISVTIGMSATTRMVLDSVRTILIWGYGLLVFGQKFQYLQLVGFAILLLGSAVYYDVLPLGRFGKYTLCCEAPESYYVVAEEPEQGMYVQPEPRASVN